jgi:hypothetical protein
MKKIPVLIATLTSFSVASLLHADLVAYFPLDSDGNSADGTFEATTEQDVEFGLPGANGATGTSASFNGSSSVIQHD